MKNQTKLIFIGVVVMVLASSVILLAAYGDHEGPVIYQVDVLPIDPGPRDNISVTVFVIDSSGVSHVQLRYTIDGTTWNWLDMNFVSCLCAAGGRWISVFGPISDEYTVRFSVRAYDNSLLSNPSDSQIFSL
ncbi:MAG: hypothetical protein ACFFE2_12260 [Candidatus Thorarchaeota archaeon]